MNNSHISSYGVLVALALSMLLASIGISIPNVALPTLAHEFVAPFSHVQWVILIYLLTMTISIVSVGRLGDRVGRRKILLSGIALYSFGALICGVAPALWLLIVARAVQGLGAASLMSLTVALVSETASPKKIGITMGLMGTMSAIGTAAGPSLGGILIALVGWQAIFILMSLLGLLSFTLAYFYLPSDSKNANSDQSGFDGLGSTILGLTLAAYALAMTVGSHFDWLNMALLAAAAIGGGLFVLTEMKVASPLIRLSALRDRNLTANLAMNTLVSTVMMSTLVVGPFYLSRALGLNAAMVGLTMSVGPLMSSISGFPGGRIVDRLGPRSVIVIGLSQMAIGLMFLSTLPPKLGLTGYIFSSAVLSPGYQLFQAANNSAVMVNVTPGERGVVSGLLSLSRNLGLITGASVMGAVFAFASKSSQISTALPASVAAGAAVTFAIAAVLTVVALLIAIGRPNSQTYLP